MSYRVSLLVFGSIMLLLLVGCGGGGQNVTPSPETKTFDIPAKTDVNKTVGGVVISIPKGAFQTKTSMTIVRRVPTTIPQSSSVSLIEEKADVEIKFGSRPSAPITLTAASVVKSGKGVAGTIILLVKKTQTGWKIINNVAHDVISQTEMLLDPSGFIENGGLFGVGGVVISVAYGVVSSQTVEFTFDDNLPPRALVFVNGFNSKPENFKMAADYFKQFGIYREIIGFGYDWRQDIDVSGRELAEAIQELRDIGCDHIDIVAHSAGVVVARYALERLNQTKNVDHLYAVCGANEGSVWASTADFLKGLQEWYLDLPAGECPPLGIATIDAPVIEQLKKNSPFLKEMNSPKLKQRGAVSYIFLGGGLDLVVGKNSGLANDVNLEAMTGGLIERHSVAAATHSSLVMTKTGLGILKDKAWPSGGTNTALYAPTRREASYDRWTWQARIINQGNESVTLQDFSIDSYDITGVWTNTWWYDPATPPGIVFPEQYVRWGRTLVSGGDIMIDFESRHDPDYTPIGQLPTEDQAFTYVVTLRFTDHGRQYFWSSLIQFGYQNVWPNAPLTRTKGVTRSKRSAPAPAIQ